MPWSSLGGGDVNKNDFPGSSLFRGEKHLQNRLILWEGSSSSMEMGHEIKKERRHQGLGQEKGHKDAYICGVPCFCE